MLILMLDMKKMLYELTVEKVKFLFAGADVMGVYPKFGS